MADSTSNATARRRRGWRGATRSPVEAYLGRLRRRAALLHGLRAAVAVLGAGALAFALAALCVGPLGSTPVAALGWATVAAAAGGVLVWAWRAFASVRGAGASRLLGVVGPALPSAARSAYELAKSPPGAASSAMIRAHAERVQAELGEIPVSAVVRWSWLKHPSVALGVAAAGLAVALLASERGSAGAYALVHPGARDAQGQRVAVAFSDVEAHLVYPSYLSRSSETVLDPSVLELPRGTSIELRARARMPAVEAALQIGDRTAPMDVDAEGRHFARFVVREDGRLVLRLRQTEGDWIRDAAERRVLALTDEAPQVSLIDPVDDVLLDRPAEVPIVFGASDDVGLGSVDLVLRSADGTVSRRRLSSYEAEEHPQEASGTTSIDPAALGMQPGDSVTLWLEAKDGDLVSGPNVGRSTELTVTIASEATRREQRLAGLEAVLDRAIHLLADRLEREVPEADAPAKERFESLQASTQGFVEALREHAGRLRSEQGPGADVALYTAMASRVRRLLHEERLAHGRRLSPVAQRRALDARAVEELEEDVLSLDDLLGRARVEDAAAIARELESLRREIHSLLAELRRTDSAEARQRLLAAIARAQARTRELMQRIAEMGTNVPQEFMNQGEMPLSQSADALAQLGEAVQRGDLEQADQLVDRLAQQIDQLARALGQTEQSFVEARFGPRERAMANAMDALGGLEAEQQQLARRGTERRSRAAGRALESIGGRDNEIGQRLAAQTRAVRQVLEGIDRDRLASFEQDGYDRARQRLVDTEDALSAGDLGEARRMAQTAAQDLSTLSRDLDLSALMFPGHEGETSEDASHARRADRQLGDLRRQLDEALPDVASHLEARDRTQMRGDRSRQGEVREAAGRLAEQFEQGPDGSPLFPDTAARELREAVRQMQDAERALGEGDPLESARAQEEAARRLTELREQLENEQQSGSSGGEGGDATPDMRRPVQIPDADQFEGPMEMRRRLLDAMREAPPRGYEDAVRRYYEGLLR